jgi:hypothetical protein
VSSSPRPPEPDHGLPPPPPADAVDRWARDQLGVGVEATADEIRTALLRAVVTADEPPAELLSAFRHRCGFPSGAATLATITALEREQRAEVAAFAARFFELPPPDRQRAWCDLHQRCQNSARATPWLAELEPHLEVTAPAEGPAALLRLAHLWAAVITAAPPDRPLERARLWEALQAEADGWKTPVLHLCEAHPIFAGLEPNTLARLRGLMVPFDPEGEQPPAAVQFPTLVVTCQPPDPGDWGPSLNGTLELGPEVGPEVQRQKAPPPPRPISPFSTHWAQPAAGRAPLSKPYISVRVPSHSWRRTRKPPPDDGNWVGWIGKVAVILILFVTLSTWLTPTPPGPRSPPPAPAPFRTFLEDLWIPPGEQATASRAQDSRPLSPDSRTVERGRSPAATPTSAPQGPTP